MFFVKMCRIKSSLFPSNIAETLVVTEGSKVVPAAPAHPLTPLALHCKAESVVSATSQCSFSSTIVHVGDKKPPESGLDNDLWYCGLVFY